MASAANAGAAGKKDVMMYEPDRLTIVTDPKHYLFDERINLPLSEAMIANIMYHGVIEPIVVQRDTESDAILVVAGRQRVRNAIEANKRLTAQGLPTILVPALMKRGDAAAMAGIMVSENEVRESDNYVTRASKMQRLLDLGRTESDLAVIFGVNEQTVRNTLALLDCSAAVLKAVESGSINVSTAQKLSKLTKEEQKAKLKEIIENTAGKTGHAKSKAVAKVVDTGIKMRSKAEVIAMLSRCPTDSVARIVIGWVLMGPDESFALPAPPVEPKVPGKRGRPAKVKDAE